MKLLCTADIHLGRQPSRLPEALPVPPSDLGPAAAWRRLVDLALDEGVTAVLIAGDVVDRDDDFFEAYADLRDGVTALAAAGIEVIAVAGNHDTRVLPRLADALVDTPGGFSLLGRDGAWEVKPLTGPAGERVEVVGWSFPKPSTTTDPLASGVPPRGDGAEAHAVARIGLLHCDRDQTGSRYAPVRSSALEAAPVDAWLLGHVHRPDIAPGERPMGYLGSLVGTDPGEPGAHGAWLLEVAADGRLSLALAPLAPLRWETRAVALDGLEEGDEVAVRITEALDALDAEIGEDPRPLAVGCRLRLTGRTRHRAAVSEALRRDDPIAGPPALRNGTSYFIDALALDALPAYDLAALAGERSPAGALAQRLLLLEGGGDPAERKALIERARRRLGETATRPPLSGGTAAPPDEARTVELLRRAGYEALDSLLAQRGEAS